MVDLVLPAPIGQSLDIHATNGWPREPVNDVLMNTVGVQEALQLVIHDCQCKSMAVVLTLLRSSEEQKWSEGNIAMSTNCVFQAMLTTLWSTCIQEFALTPTPRYITPEEYCLRVQALCTADNRCAEHRGCTTKLQDADMSHAIWDCPHPATTCTPPSRGFR